MSELLELLLELLLNRLGLFILGVALIIGGFYGWRQYRHDAALYDSAISKEGREAEARIAWKNRESTGDYHDDGSTTYNYYLDLEYETEHGTQKTKVYVDPDEYDSVELSKNIRIRYPPENLQFVVTPKMERPSVFWATIGFGFLIILGLFICLGVLISLF